MGEKRRVVLGIFFATFFHISYGCQMENVANWAVPQPATIYDHFRGTIFSRSTTNIEEITGVTYGEATLRGPYFDVSLVDSQLIIETNAAYEDYEEHEVSTLVSITVDFRCSGVTPSASLTFLITITDTNNNYPIFIPTNSTEFMVTPPLPPGYIITGCFDYITVRDIDLTTQRIDFTMDDNPYFEIEYVADASSVAKEFNAVIKTKTFIRSLAEPLTYTITATDVDLTEGPPLSTTATVLIVGDSEFQFPEEPVFAQAFYLAIYTETHQLNLLETISLQQGFDEYVNFVLEGEYSDNFNLIPNINEISLDVVTPLSADIWSQRQTYLIVRAVREFTSGDTTTVVVQFPEEEPLEFESAIYEGAIINNALQVSQLVLTQGYDSNSIDAEVEGEYSSYFTASVQGDLITLSMLPLSDQIIENNSFISIQVIASSDRSQAATVVNLGVIKDDNVTPVFDKSIYYATYDPNTGLDAEQIIFVQGFDDTVSVNLVGEYASLFQINQGLIITLTSSTIPPELYSLQNILISIEASKPRTVGANAAISIALPAAREIEFEESIYRGTIEDNEIRLDTIRLRVYEEGATFQLSGEYSTYFNATSTEEGQVVISLSSVLPDTVITQNNVILLTLTAAGTNIIPTSANILLDVIKEDTTTPLFTRNIYYGTYETTLQIEDINLAQGYDNGVTFRLDGAHSQYFSVSNTNGNNAVITLQSPIPEEVIFNKKVLLFNVLADKALTVGANAAVLIAFPSELTNAAVMRFSQSAYIGQLEENNFTLESIVLETGFATGTEFHLTGDYSEHFNIIDSTTNVVQISSLGTLPNEVMENNEFLLLEIEARRQRAVSAWTSIVVDIVKQEMIAPVFNQAYYTGVYTEEIGLMFEEAIRLEEGYDETVTFALVGEWSSLFRLVPDNDTASLVLAEPMPTEIVENNNQLLLTVVAENSYNLTGRAVISIDLPKEPTEDSAILGFDRVTYAGSIVNGQSNIPVITLSEGYVQGVQFSLYGELSEYFSVTPQGALVTIALQTAIPENSIPANQIILLELHATAPSAIPAVATIVLEYVVDENGSSIVELIFAQTFYSGSYSTATGVLFPIPISLNEGYDSGVVFALEGDHAQWFGLQGNQNSMTVVLTSPIPAGVLSNNQQLVFVVNAQKPGSATARATVVIELTDELTEDSAILGFDRVTYAGSIENGQSNIPVITLSEGYVQGVQFSLYGELSEYFSVTPQGALVTIALQTAIPENSIPANRIILLELHATAPSAIPAVATIVLEYVVDENGSSIVELIFAQTFYSGSYSTATGVLFPTPISLTEGYDSGVVFALEGDHAQWFGLQGNQNSMTVVLTSPIPAGVLSNNQQLVFVVNAQKPGSATARATVVIELTDELTEDSAILGFDRVTYAGSIENGQSNIPVITLSEGYVQGVQFSLYGELSEYFSVTPQGALVTIALQTAIPENSIPANRIILLELHATAPSAIPAVATIVLEYVVDENGSSIVELIFAQTFYSGSYSTATGVLFPTPISLTEGYDSGVVFALEGDHAQWFGLQGNQNSMTVVLTSPIPAGVLSNNQQLVFVVNAQKPGSATARATVVIELTDELTEDSAILGFDRVTYAGSIENGQSNIPVITLSEGYVQGVQFSLYGELSEYFSVTPQGALVTIALQTAIPENSIPANRIILLELHATAPSAIPAVATIVLEYVVDENGSSIVELIFAQTFYSGSYSTATGVLFPIPISLTEGYDSGVVFALEGDHAQWFGLQGNQNSMTVVLTSPIPAGVLSNNQQLVFVVNAQKPGSATARATVVIELTDELTEDSAILGFDRVTYAGSIENGQSNIPVITLSEGFVQGVQFSLYGELSEYFSVTPQGALVTIALQTAIPENSIPANRIILLELHATAPSAIPAVATIVLEYVVDENGSSIVELIFAQTFYSGSYSTATGVLFPTPISLTEGYDSGVVFALEGDHAQWFGLQGNQNSMTVVLTSPIPAGVLSNNQQLVFVVNAQKPGSATARATVVIELTDESQTGLDVTFEKALYEGIVQNGVVSHETIVITGFSGSIVELYGEYSTLFESELSNNEVRVQTSSSLTLPADVNHIVLELRAGTAATVLLLNVIQTDGPSTPTVTFSSPFYAVRVDITQTGLIGQVQATSDNGENVLYSLLLNNAHLEERLSVNSEGELHLWAHVNTGVYTFQVIATTVFTQTSGTATVHLSVDAVTVCGGDNVVAPLIVLDVDEEEPHYNLIDGAPENCHFTLTNRWPLDQSWLYIHEGGLHTTAIDREHESIAFMAVSQIQVEVILHCEGDATRSKRSVTSDALGPYDYGNNKWILTDTIQHNSRRSLVNVIVNDINDNAPMFIGKEAEPIAVGYVIPDLAERILPRSLTELQATDADIGENAVLLYWSSAPELAVAPTTGFVHVRDGSTLTHGTTLTVHATDRNGAGLTGSIDILVRLLDESNIAVVTVRDAFLDDEQTVLSHLSEGVGYEVKVLRSVVISDSETNEENSRRRDVTNETGATLQLYVYGLIEREPVAVDRLTTDISNIALTAVIVASTVSLEDHLEAQEICVIAGRDTGLLVATIVLSVLLFIVLVLIAVWFFLRWRRKKNYDQFSDENSIASRNESVDKFPRPEVFPKPRLDIAELKKSERRLQEMLDAPVSEVITEPTSSRNDAILDMPTPEPLTPIVIQSIDKLKDAADESSDDEFGEVKSPRRKSVVTFNENVEKIIHLEDTEPEDISTNADYEIYQL